MDAVDRIGCNIDGTVETEAYPFRRYHYRWFSEDG